MLVLALLACVLAGFGAYSLACAFADIPTSKTSRMMLLSRKQQGVKPDKLPYVYIMRVAAAFEKYVKLDKLKRGKLQAVLAIAGVEASPEAYTLKAYITALLVALCSVPAFAVQPLFAMAIVGLAVASWFSAYYAAFDFVAKRKSSSRPRCPGLP